MRADAIGTLDARPPRQPGGLAGTGDAAGRSTVAAASTPPRPAEMPRTVPSTASSTSVTFEEVLQQHGSRVKRLCRRLTSHHPDADDLAQDVFVICYQRWSSFRGDASIETWLIGIALRTCRNWQRKQAIRRKARSMVAYLKTKHPVSHDTMIAQKDDLQQALQKMDMKSKEVLVMYYMEHQSIASIAGCLGCTVPAVQQRLSRARERLAILLGDES